MSVYDLWPLFWYRVLSARTGHSHWMHPTPASNLELKPKRVQQSDSVCVQRHSRHWRQAQRPEDRTNWFKLQLEAWVIVVVGPGWFGAPSSTPSWIPTPSQPSDTPSKHERHSIRRPVHKSSALWRERHHRAHVQKLLLVSSSFASPGALRLTPFLFQPRRSRQT